MNTLALYIHWPYCLSKCPYCDFASRPIDGAADEARMVRAYTQELEHYAARLPEREISSLFFGGGTPSLMAPESVHEIVSAVQRYWPLAPDCEVTLEANPAAADIGKFKAFRAAGVNRLSIGVQSFNDDVLRFLGRAHDAATAREAIRAAAATFDRFSFDLMYAYAAQTGAAWRDELNEALSFSPRHLSLYQLTIEERTPFFKRAAKESLCVDEDTAAGLYDLTQEVLSAANLPAYEVSNHAAAGEESRHNMTYWTYGDYVGIGSAAHGRFVDGEGRKGTENIAHPREWIEQVTRLGHGRAFEALITPKDAQTEALLMGLRLTKGIDKARWRALFGEEVNQSLPSGKVAMLVREGLLCESATHLATTAKGRLCLNAVLAAL